MILTTHGYVGASLFKIFSFYPPLGFFLALISHFGLDFLSHWDYRLNSLVKDKSDGCLKFNKHSWSLIIVDILKITADFFFGLLLIFFFFNLIGYQISFFILIAYFLACLPDLNQLFNSLLKLNENSNFLLNIIKRPVEILHSVHQYSHGFKKLDFKKGVLSQILIILFVSFLLVLLK